LDSREKRRERERPGMDLARGRAPRTPELADLMAAADSAS